MACSSDLRYVLEIYPVATVRQLSVLLGTSEQVIRRWTRKNHSIRTAVGSASRSGRPQQLLSLTGCNSRHDFQVTEYAVSLIQKWQSAYIPIHPSIYSLVDWNGPIPDLGYVITTSDQSHLFFLEIDRGSEPLVRSSQGTDLYSKICAYLKLRVSGKHHLACANSRGFQIILGLCDYSKNQQRKKHLRQIFHSLPLVMVKELNSET